MDLFCPLCGSPAVKVIYFGLPHQFCTSDNCNCLFGFWANITGYIPAVNFDAYGDPCFAFMEYDGSYFIALLHWLLGDYGDND